MHIHGFYPFIISSSENHYQRRQNTQTPGGIARAEDPTGRGFLPRKLKPCPRKAKYSAEAVTYHMEESHSIEIFIGSQFLSSENTEGARVMPGFL